MIWKIYYGYDYAFPHDGHHLSLIVNLIQNKMTYEANRADSLSLSH